MRRVSNVKLLSTRDGSFTAHRRDVQIKMREEPEIRMAGDPIRRLLLIDPMIGQWIEMTMDAAEELRAGLANAEQAFALFPAPGPAKFLPPVTAEMREGVLIRVAADALQECIALDIAIDGKPHRWIGLSVEQSQAMRAGIDKVLEALRMQHA